MAIFQADGIDLKGFVDLLTLLKNEHRDGSLKLLSTHPLTAERLRMAEEKAKEQGNVKEDAELERKWEGVEKIYK